MRRPHRLVLAFAVLFASSSLVLVFATNAYDEPAAASATGQAIAKLAELVGEDADGNGIRDDVDAFIAQRYGKDAAMRSAAEQIARSIQPALAVDLAKVSSTADLAENEVAVMSCVIQALGPLRRADAEDMINQVTDKTYDNSMRFQKREAFRQQARGADFTKPRQCEKSGHMLSTQL